MKQDLTILIASCDAYKGTREPFFLFFKKFRADCPYNIALMTNSEKPDIVGVKILNIKKSNRGTEMKTALNMINTQYILYIQDDYFFTSHVITNIFEKYLSFIKSHNWWYLRLFPYPWKRKETITQYEIEWNKIVQIYKWTPFINSLQLAIWDKQVFLDILSDWDKIWDFEMNAYPRTANIKKNFFSLARKDYLTPLERVYPINYVCTWIRRGKWHKKAFLYCKEFWINLDLKYRWVENFRDLLKKEWIYNKAPYCLRKRLQKFLW